LGNGPAIRGLLNLQKEEDPDILFLSVTKMDERRIEGLRWKLGLTNLVVKDCVGKSGGLAIFWKKEINLQLHMCLSSTSTLMWWRRMVLFGGCSENGLSCHISI